MVTYFRVRREQTIDADTLRDWRTRLLDNDDVFKSEFLREIIFGGVESGDVHITNEATKLFETWQTQNIRYAPHLDTSDGPYYVDQTYFYSVWRIYEDSNLAFVQSTWPATGENGLGSLHQSEYC